MNTNMNSNINPSVHNSSPIPTVTNFEKVNSKDKPRSLYFQSLSFRPQNIHFMNQNQNEEILLFLRQHKIVLVPPIFWSFVFAFLPPILGYVYAWGANNGFSINLGISAGIWTSITILWYFIIFAYLFQTFLGWFFNVYCMTNQRLIDFDFNGLLSHGADETNLQNIETAESAIGGLWGTVFNMGIITVRSAADKNNMELNNIPDPAKVRDYIMDHVISMDTKN